VSDELQRLRQLWAHFCVDKYGDGERAEDSEYWFYVGATSMWIAIFEMLEDASDEDKSGIDRALNAITQPLMAELMAHFGIEPHSSHKYH
jgi:hypothetical protein